MTPSTLAPELLRRLVARASRAPSAHNTQPARWRFAGARAELHEDTTRWLRVGDPARRDQQLALGAAWEGLALALSEEGLALAEPALGERLGTPPEASLQLVAAATLGGRRAVDPLAAYTAARRSYRGGFRAATAAESAALRALLANRDDVAVVAGEADLRALATQYDDAAVHCLREPGFAAELYRWMRFSARDPGWDRDGLTAACLGLSAVEAWGARFALRPGPLALLRAARLDGLLVAEAAKVASATAVVLLQRRRDESLFAAGRALYRRWLELERAGFAAVPMSALLDSPRHRDALLARHPPPAGAELVMVLRVGPKPETPPPASARLPVDELLV